MNVAEGLLADENLPLLMATGLTPAITLLGPREVFFTANTGLRGGGELETLALVTPKDLSWFFLRATLLMLEAASMFLWTITAE